MSLEVRPYGVKCNIQCTYCYQAEVRDAGNALPSYDLERMMDAIAEANEPFTLFGGEPLLMRRRDLERLWAWGFERFGVNRVQTNGTLITPAHVDLFRRYAVKVGISVDGPDELNGVRWAGNAALTTRATERTHAAIRMLADAGMPPGLIVTLHRANAAPDRLPRLLEWLLEMELIGVKSVRLHLLEVDSEHVRETYGMDEAAYVGAMTGLMRFERDRLTTMSFDVFAEMRELLAGRDRGTSCVWNACDPYNTRAVRGIEGNGQRTNCGRTNKDGVDFVKADTSGFERYLTLYETPQPDGGCSGCRFFLMCKGQCPGTALGGDWRNRTEHCEVYKALYGLLESEALQRGEIPLSVDARRTAVEEAVLSAWSIGEPLFIEDALAATPT